MPRLSSKATGGEFANGVANSLTRPLELSVANALHEGGQEATQSEHGGGGGNCTRFGLLGGGGRARKIAHQPSHTQERESSVLCATGQVLPTLKLLKRVAQEAFSSC